MNEQVIEITTEDKSILCDYCHKSEVNSLEWGPLYRYGGVTVHYFCMLFSAGLSQNGQDEEGILGFLPKDIKKELRRGDKLRCKFCKQSRATIGCSKKTCKLSYHYPCGLQQSCEYHFISNFESYCSKHREIKNIPLPKNDWECPICFIDVTEKDIPLWPPCCKKKVFHKRCIMEMAKNHGAHFFKCPLCNEKDIFSKAMKKSGVYVPDRDATWETGNAFAEQTRTYSRCDAAECVCPKGRDHSSNSDSKPWKVIRCGACGAAGIHKKCGDLKNLTWRCPTCSRILSDKRKSDVLNTSRIQRHNYDTSSDEENNETDTPITSVQDIVTPPPAEERSVTLVKFGESSAIQLADSKRNYVVEQSSEEEYESNDTDVSDNDAGCDEVAPVFISPEAKEKIMKRKGRNREKQKVNNKLKLSSRRQPIRYLPPGKSPASDVVLNPAPSFPPLGKDTLIKTNPHRAAKAKRVKVSNPEIINESGPPNGCHISMKDVHALHNVLTNDELDEIQIFEPPVNENQVETVNLDDESDSDELEIVSEKINPTPVTRSSTLTRIMEESRGNKVGQLVIPAILRQNRNLTVSTAFLSAMRESRKTRNACETFKTQPKDKKQRIDGGHV